MGYADFIPTVAGVLSTMIAQGKTADELTVLAAIFTEVGQSLTYIAALRVIEDKHLGGEEDGETNDKGKPRRSPTP